MLMCHESATLKHKLILFKHLELFVIFGLCCCVLPPASSYMYTGQIDGNGNDLYPDIQILDGETVLLLFHKDSSKFQN